MVYFNNASITIEKVPRINYLSLEINQREIIIQISMKHLRNLIHNKEQGAIQQLLGAILVYSILILNTVFYIQQEMDVI